MAPVLAVLLLLVVLGVVFGVGLAFAAQKFHVATDPRVDRAHELLPGADCGACGFAGCRGYAEALIKEGAAPDLCRPGGPETAKVLAALLGLAHEEKARQVAILKCRGRKVGTRFDYVGIASCAAAALFQNGPKACEYGCLGMGDCARACPVGAIVMENGFPRIVETRCIACGICTRVCPKGLFAIRPVDKFVHVACSSHDRGLVVTKVCGLGCIGCRKCEKVCPADAIHVTDNLAEVDVNKCTNCKECVKACPTGVITDFQAEREALARSPATAA